MAFLRIKSDNPDLSYVIYKNPSTGMLMRNLRQGFLFGWFSTPNEYNCYFKDASNEISYKSHQNEEFEYNNTSRYNSSFFVLNAFSELFSSPLKGIKESVKDKDISDKFNNAIMLNMVFVKNLSLIEMFNKYFTDFQLIPENVSFKNYKLTFKTRKTMHELFNYVSLFVVFNALRNDESIYIDSAITEKYLNILKVIDSPYFIRYIFKNSFLDRKDLFTKYLDIVSNSSREKIKMEFGNTHQMRKSFIRKRLEMTRNIVDVGCGEGSYVTFLAPEIKEKLYVAIDSDSEQLESLAKKIERKKLENVTTFSSLDEFLSSPYLEEEYDILLTEVIEHNPLDVSEALLKRAMDFPFTRNIVITTPNKDFNQFYLFEDADVRHEDHVFEFKESEFKEWLSKQVDTSKFELEFFNVGDEVNSIPVTLGVHLRRLS